MGPLTMAGIAAGATAAKTGLQAIPTKFEREQKRRLKELQRKQELGLLGLTEAERAQIDSQLRGAREQAQRRTDAEIARLSTPTAQQGQQLMAAQLGAEGRQRMEADLAGQILGMDIQRQREQEADIAALEAGQGLRQAELRANLASIPMAAAETAIGQIGLERMINVANLSPEQRNSYLQNDLQLDETETSMLQLEGTVTPIQETDGLFPSGAAMPTLRAAQEDILEPRISANPISQELPIPQQDINIMATYDINRQELEEAYRIMNMLNERSQLGVTIDEAIRIYKNMPMYNQNLNIPFSQVERINQTAFPALGGRMNVTNTSGQEI